MAPPRTPRTETIRRYTNLPSLIHILSNRCITLLDPGTWDDRNDAYFMSLYKEKKGLKALLALCFSTNDETYHHWSVFSGGPAGVCVVFEKTRFLSQFDGVAGLKHRKVRYMGIEDARSHTFKVNDLPFLKRIGYKPEGEFRMIYESDAAECASMGVPIDLGCIRSISLSPWMPLGVADDTRRVLRSIDGCAGLRVSRSTLISNEEWKKLGRGA